MNKGSILVGVIAVGVIGGIFALYFSYPTNETVNLDMDRTHGTISTAMGSPILGNPSAPITIVEFGDYQCPQCYTWFHDTKPTIILDYIDTGKANLIFVDNVLLGYDSTKAAQASYCAEDQEMYWEYHHLLYNFQDSTIDGGWASLDNLKSFASDLGLDMDLFESCLDSDKYSKRVQYNIQQAQENNVHGMPGFFIVGPNGQKQINGPQPFSTFKQIMDPMI